ncbi:MAG TPA: DUF1576 domain-containing protein [Candidatus Tetragenococcus pullicola]|nr:DUF1576 domain-containing protein [Candidatus Tetragenococcus pullicola]
MAHRTSNNIFRFTRLIAILFIITAFIFDSPSEILSGMIRIIQSPGNLVTDYVSIGGVGAALLNSGLMTLLSLKILKKYDYNFAPSSFLHLMLLAGYSFWGKNLFNSAPIFLGLFLYIKVSDKTSQKHLSSGLLGTALAPAVSIVYFSSDRLWIKAMALLLGVILGFIMIPIFKKTLHLTFGLNLYTMGFVAGIVSLGVNFFITKILKIDVDILSTTPQHSQELFLLFFLFFTILLIYYGFLFLNHHFVQFKKMTLILKEENKISQSLREILQTFKFSIYGLIGLVVVYLLKEPLTGPLAGSILIFTGFSAYHYRFSHFLFPALGVAFSYEFFLGGLASESGLIALFFVSTMAPFCHHYGNTWGFLSGTLFPFVSKLLNLTHNGINLYNSGFAGGVTVLLLFLLMNLPLFKKHPPLRKSKQRQESLEIKVMKRISAHIKFTENELS